MTSKQEEWTRCSIGDLFEIGAGKSVTPAGRNGEPKFPFLRTSNVFWGRIDTTDVDVMCFSPSEIEVKSLQPGDLLVCEGGDIGRSAIWDGELEGCAFQNHLHRLRPKRADVVPRFFMYYLQAGFTQLGIYEGAGNKTTIPNLSRSRLAALEVPTPPKPEQQKIAAVLWKLQRAIATQDRLIATTRELKQSAMQRLFTHGLRGEPLKDTELGLMPESWDIARLDSCCDVLSSSLSYSDLLDVEDSATDASVKVHGIKVSDMNLSGNEVEITRANLLRHLESSLAERKTVPAETVVFPKRGAAIATNKKRLTTTWTVLDPNLIGVRPKQGLNYRYLFYWFEQFDLRTITEPGPTPQLNKKNLTPLQLPVPSTEDEQRDIAAALAALDRKLAHHQRKRTTLNALFQTTLHQLMTAQIRVADLDIDTSEIAMPPLQGQAA